MKRDVYFSGIGIGSDSDGIGGIGSVIGVGGCTIPAGLMAGRERGSAGGTPSLGSTNAGCVGFTGARVGETTGVVSGTTTGGGNVAGAAMGCGDITAGFVGNVGELSPPPVLGNGSGVRLTVAAGGLVRVVGCGVVAETC